MTVRKSCFYDKTVEWFFRELDPVRNKVAAYLFQLPPSCSPQPERLESFFSLLPHNYRYAFELRNPESYSGAELELWASRIRSWSDQGKEVLVCFNNDIGGHAIRNAGTLNNKINR